jgi:hypothetical protein
MDSTDHDETLAVHAGTPLFINVQNRALHAPRASQLRLQLSCWPFNALLVEFELAAKVPQSCSSDFCQATTI